MTSRSQLQQVQRLNGASLDSRNVPESLDDTLILVVNNEGSSPLGVPSVSHLSFTSSNLSGVGNLDNIVVSLDGLQQVNSGPGLGETFGIVGDDERNFLDFLDSVTSGEDQGRKSGSSQSRSDGVSSLVLVDL